MDTPLTNLVVQLVLPVAVKGSANTTEHNKMPENRGATRPCFNLHAGRKECKIAQTIAQTSWLRSSQTLQLMQSLGESWGHSATSVLFSCQHCRGLFLTFHTALCNGTCFMLAQDPGAFHNKCLACPVIAARSDEQQKRAPFDALSAKCSVHP